jgi:hypothetical protein
MDAQTVPADDGAVPAGGRGHISGIVSDLFRAADARGP